MVYKRTSKRKRETLGWSTKRHGHAETWFIFGYPVTARRTGTSPELEREKSASGSDNPDHISGCNSYIFDEAFHPTFHPHNKRHIKSVHTYKRWIYRWVERAWKELVESVSTTTFNDQCITLRTLCGLCAYMVPVEISQLNDPKRRSVSVETVVVRGRLTRLPCGYAVSMRVGT